MDYNYPQISEHCPIFNQQLNNGMFGYKGKCVEIVISKQDTDGIQKAFELGWINPKTPSNMQMLNSISLLTDAKNRGLKVSAKKLEELGFQ